MTGVQGFYSRQGGTQVLLLSRFPLTRTVSVRLCQLFQTDTKRAECENSRFMSIKGPTILMAKWSWFVVFLIPSGLVPVLTSSPPCSRSVPAQYSLTASYFGTLRQELTVRRADCWCQTSPVQFFLQKVAINRLVNRMTEERPLLHTTGEKLDTCRSSTTFHKTVSHTTGTEK